MSIEKIKKKLQNEAVKDDKWMEEASWRQENKAWLDLSFAIATKILTTIRAKKMSQKDLAEKLGCSPQYLNKILKGTENLTIETISKVERVLGVKLIEIPTIETRAAYKPEAGMYRVKRSKMMVASIKFNQSYQPVVKIHGYENYEVVA